MTVKSEFFLHINAICWEKNGRCIVLTGAFIDLLCYPVLVEKYFINRYVYLIQSVPIWRTVLLTTFKYYH
jgi:hypothetical protein